MSSAEKPKLTCWYLQQDPSELKKLPTPSDANSSALPQETGKKSSFLATNVSKKFPKPVHLVIEYEHDKVFFLGGFQLVSNARHVEVYLTAADSAEKEQYLMTSKGIAVDKERYWHKAVSVVPGGPKPVRRLHIKLLSLQPENEEMAAIQSLKVTARVPDQVAATVAQQTNATEDNNSKESKQNNNTNMSSAFHLQQAMMGISPSNSSHSKAPPTAQPGLTQSDLGSAMATMSLLVRSTEERVTQHVTSSVEKLSHNVSSQLSKLEHQVLQLTSVVVSQKNVMLEQRDLTIKQQSRLLEQDQQIHKLLEQQTRLLNLVTSLEKQVVTMNEAQQRDREEREQSLRQELEDIKQQRSLEMEMQALEMAQMELEISEEIDAEEKKRQRNQLTSAKSKIEKTLESFSENYCHQFMEILQPPSQGGPEENEPQQKSEAAVTKEEEEVIPHDTKKSPPRKSIEEAQLKGIEKFKKGRHELEKEQSEVDDNDKHPVPATASSLDDEDTICSTSLPSSPRGAVSVPPADSIEEESDEDYDDTINSTSLPSNPRAPKTLQPAKSINEDEEEHKTVGNELKAGRSRAHSSDSSTIERPPSPDNTLTTIGRSSHSDETRNKDWHIVDRSLEQDMLIWKEP